MFKAIENALSSQYFLLNLIPCTLLTTDKSNSYSLLQIYHGSVHVYPPRDKLKKKKTNKYVFLFFFVKELRHTHNVK